MNHTFFFSDFFPQEYCSAYSRYHATTVSDKYTRPVSGQRLGKRVLLLGSRFLIMQQIHCNNGRAVFSTWSVPRGYKRDKDWSLVRVLPCGGGFEYLHRSPASSKRRRKGNPVPGGITGPPCSWGDINTGTWPSRLGESRI
jgi:hypothetical protein